MAGESRGRQAAARVQASASAPMLARVMPPPCRTSAHALLYAIPGLCGLASRYATSDTVIGLESRVPTARPLHRSVLAIRRRSCFHVMYIGIFGCILSCYIPLVSLGFWLVGTVQYGMGEGPVGSDVVLSSHLRESCIHMYIPVTGALTTSNIVIL